MKYAARLGIVFIAVIFAGKVTAGIDIENQWYEFFLAIIFGACNGLIRTVIELNNWKLSWSHVAIFAFFVNFFLYILVYLGFFAWLGVTIFSFGGVILATIIVTIVSALVNHFKGFKTKIE